MVVLQKEYQSDSLSDVEDDISAALDDYDYPLNSEGYIKGRFKIIVEYIEDNKGE